MFREFNEEVRDKKLQMLGSKSNRKRKRFSGYPTDLEARVEISDMLIKRPDGVEITIPASFFYKGSKAGVVKKSKREQYKKLISGAIPE